MKRSRPPARKTAMKRSAMKRRHERIDADEEEAFRRAVTRRSGGRCERCRRPSCQIHHRRTREERWSRWLPDNGLDLCRACHHDLIHANIDWAFRHMLILSRHSITHPAPVLHCSIECSLDHRDSGLPLSERAGQDVGARSSSN